MKHDVNRNTIRSPRRPTACLSDINRRINEGEFRRVLHDRDYDPLGWSVDAASWPKSLEAKDQQPPGRAVRLLAVHFDTPGKFGAVRALWWANVAPERAVGGSDAVSRGQA